MMRAVRFDKHGGLDVLNIVQVPVPSPKENEVLVNVMATSINPGEVGIREGKRLIPSAPWPSYIRGAMFPSGQGSDFSGIIDQIGKDVKGYSVGDEIIGFSHNRDTQAEYVIATLDNITRKPQNISWAVGGSLPMIGFTAYGAVKAVGLKPGESVGVSGAAGGVGLVIAQLAKKAGANVIGIAGVSAKKWLEGHGIKHNSYGDGMIDQLRDLKLDAFIDGYGDEYVKIAIDLGIKPERINTIANFQAAQQYGIKADGGTKGREIISMEELSKLLGAGDIEIPIAATFPLENIKEAYQLLAQCHTHGKIVIVP